MRHFRQSALLLAWIISVTGGILSLYFAEILQIEPCLLCWYQRMALFPLILILGIALYRGDPSVVAYALPLSIFGGAVALYQILGGYFPWLLQFSPCGSSECKAPIFTLWGFLTFPLLSAFGFTSIALLLCFVPSGKSPSSL